MERPLDSNLHNLEKRVFELNKAAGAIAREVADQADRLVIVAGSMGPTGEMIEPHGLMTPKRQRMPLEHKPRVLQRAA